MKNPLILHIETATDICSVAISEGDQQLASAESGPERSHATLLNSFIRKCLQKSNKKLQEIEAISEQRTRFLYRVKDWGLHGKRDCIWPSETSPLYWYSPKHGRRGQFSQRHPGADPEAWFRFNPMPNAGCQTHGGLYRLLKPGA